MIDNIKKFIWKLQKYTKTCLQSLKIPIIFVCKFENVIALRKDFSHEIHIIEFPFFFKSDS